MLWILLAVVAVLALFVLRLSRRRAAAGGAEPGEDTSDRHPVEAALSKSLREQGIHEGFEGTIRRLVFEDNDEWRRCCGSGCDPCVLQMERAVDDVRRAIAWKPGMEDPGD